MARQESSLLQFDGTDPSYHHDESGSWGYGMMMITNPPATAEQLWNWWANVDAGKSRLDNHKSSLEGTWATRVEQWEQWNTGHPGQEVGPPVFPSEDPSKPACGFVWANGDYGFDSQPSFKDACWIKRYNGLGTEGKDYLIWQNTGDFAQNPRWERYNIATKPGGLQENYVQNICRQDP
jgi:hypothetical protein